MRPAAAVVFLSLVVTFPLTMFGQCHAPELVRGADKYNAAVCKAYGAEKVGNNEEALELLLAASELPVLESPNIRLFGHLALEYAKVKRFEESERYLAYDNLSILWMIGIVRCQLGSNSGDEVLLQDGRLLASAEANRLSKVLCGPVFDEYSYSRERKAESFVPAARAILLHAELREKIRLLKSKQQ
jgi:hypothetical protein